MVKFSMVDLKMQKWDLHPREEAAIKWLNEHDYDVVLVKQYLSKLVFDVSKNGITEIFEFPKSVTDVDNYMKLFEKSFKLATEIAKKEKGE